MSALSAVINSIKNMNAAFNQQLTVCGDGYDLPGIILPLAISVFTAASIPPQQGTSIRTTVTLFDVVGLENSGELFCIIHRIKLGTANERNVVFDKPFVEIP